MFEPLYRKNKQFIWNLDYSTRKSKSNGIPSGNVAEDSIKSFLLVPFLMITPVLLWWKCPKMNSNWLSGLYFMIRSWLSVFLILATSNWWTNWMECEVWLEVGAEMASSVLVEQHQQRTWDSCSWSRDWCSQAWGTWQLPGGFTRGSSQSGQVDATSNGSMVQQMGVINICGWGTATESSDKAVASTIGPRVHIDQHRCHLSLAVACRCRTLARPPGCSPATLRCCVQIPWCPSWCCLRDRDLRALHSRRWFSRSFDPAQAIILKSRWPGLDVIKREVARYQQRYTGIWKHHSIIIGNVQIEHHIKDRCLACCAAGVTPAVMIALDIRVFWWAGLQFRCCVLALIKAIVHTRMLHHRHPQILFSCLQLCHS